MFYEEEATFAMGGPQQSPATCTSLLFIWCLKFHRETVVILPPPLSITAKLRCY